MLAADSVERHCIFRGHSEVIVGNDRFFDFWCSRTKFEGSDECEEATGTKGRFLSLGRGKEDFFGFGRGRLFFGCGRGRENLIGVFMVHGERRTVRVGRGLLGEEAVVGATVHFAVTRMASPLSRRGSRFCGDGISLRGGRDDALLLDCDVLVVEAAHERMFAVPLSVPRG